MTTVLIIIFCLLLVAVIVIIIASDILTRIACHREGFGKRREYELSETQKIGKAWFEGMKPESVSIESNDGLTLRGQLLVNPNARRLVICAHGYRSFGMCDFSPIVRFYYEHNCSLLVISQRACGESDGKYITFGLRERFDLQKWAYFIANRFEALPLYLHGVSLGGATVLMTSSLELPKSVHGIIDDCGYTSAGEILRHVMKKWFNLPPFPLYYTAKLLIKQRCGFDPDETDAPTALSKTQLPILMVHGDADDFVPTEMSRVNFAAGKSEKKLIIVENAHHAESYMLETERLNGELLEFFDRCEKAAPNTNMKS